MIPGVTGHVYSNGLIGERENLVPALVVIMGQPSLSCEGANFACDIALVEIIASAK